MLSEKIADVTLAGAPGVPGSPEDPALTVHNNHVARLDRVLPPAVAQQKIEAAQFAIPLDGFAGFILHFHVNPGMRVHPLETNERALQLNRLFRIVLRSEGMMRKRRKRSQRCGENECARKFQNVRQV